MSYTTSRFGPAFPDGLQGDNEVLEFVERSTAMTVGKRFATLTAVAAAIAVSSLATAHGTTKTISPPLSITQLQSLSSEGPTWHAGDGTVYDPNGAVTASASRSASSIIALQRSRSGPPLTGTQVQPGDMGPNSTKAK